MILGCFFEYYTSKLNVLLHFQANCAVYAASLKNDSKQ